MTPLQKQFLNVAILKLQELEEERIKGKKGSVNKTLKSEYDKRKK